MNLKQVKAVFEAELRAKRPGEMAYGAIAANDFIRDVLAHFDEETEFTKEFYLSLKPTKDEFRRYSEWEHSALKTFYSEQYIEKKWDYWPITMESDHEIDFSCTDFRRMFRTNEIKQSKKEKVSE